MVEVQSCRFIFALELTSSKLKAKMSERETARKERSEAPHVGGLCQLYNTSWLKHG